MTTMNTQKPNYGEPWKIVTYGSEQQYEVIRTRDDKAPERLRAVQCVNAFAGVPDPAAELARLRRLDWTPVTERLPTLEDADEFEDVEWSDGKDIWQGGWRSGISGATHWRPITLPCARLSRRRMRR